MEEDNSQTTIEYFDDNVIDGEIVEVTDIALKPKLTGVCSKCLGSKYLMTERNGMMGVLYTSENEDSEGKPIKRLLSCNCSVTTTY